MSETPAKEQSGARSARAHPRADIGEPYRLAMARSIAERIFLECAGAYEPLYDKWVIHHHVARLLGDMADDARDRDTKY